MQSARWTRLTLIAWAAAAAAAGAQQGPAPGDAVHGAAPPADDRADSREWLVPPIAWTGSLAYDMRATRAQREGTTLGQLVTGNIGARTFIYQPWFAVVSGDLGLTSSWTQEHPDNSAPDGPLQVSGSLHEQIQTRERFATGHGRIDLFPQSRFPFEAHVERNDSRIDSGLASTFNFQTQNIGFSQRYRPLAGNWDLNAGYDRREQTGLGFKATQDLVTADFNTHWKYNQLNLNGSQSHARSTGIVDDSRYGTLVARHNFAPSTALSLDTTANFTRTQDQTLSAASDLQVLQWSSVGLWRPEKSPLQVTGTGRALHLQDDLNNTALDTWSFTLGGNYDYNPNLRLTANTGVNATRSGSSDSNGVSAAVGANYQGDSLTLGGARYDWFTGGSAAVSSTQGNNVESERQTALNLQLGHTLNRPWVLGPSSTLTLNFGQTLSYTKLQTTLHHAADGSPADVMALNNTLSGTWNMGAGERTAYARATYTDVKTLQGPDNRFQLFNFQLSGNFQFDNLRSLTGDLTYQQTWQQNAQRLDGSSAPLPRLGSSGASGEVVYRHQRLFGMPRLRFESRLRLAQDVLKQPGTLQALPDRETRLWENRLDWSVGRIDMQMILRLSSVDRRSREAFMFRIQRTFGD